MLGKCLPNCLPGLWPLWLLSPDRRLTHSPHGEGGRGGEDEGRAWVQRPRALPAQAA